jgi:hypothetical protein
MNINLTEIQEKLKSGEPIPTGFNDINGDPIFLGTRLFKVEYSPLTYEIRIRNGQYVMHTGGCYTVLNEHNAKKCKIDNNVSLRDGATLFNDKLIC